MPKQDELNSIIEDTKRKGAARIDEALSNVSLPPEQDNAILDNLAKAVNNAINEPENGPDPLPEEEEIKIEADPSPEPRPQVSAPAPSPHDRDLTVEDVEYTDPLRERLMAQHEELQVELARLGRLVQSAMKADSAVMAALTSLNKDGV